MTVAAAAEPLRHGRGRGEIFCFMMLATAVNYFGRIIVSIAGPDIMKQYGFSETQLGSVYSAFGATYMLAMIPAGWLIDRIGPHRTLAAFGMVSALITAASALAGLGASSAAMLPLLFLSRLLFGICSAPVFPACGRLTGNWWPPARFGFVQGCVGGASAIGASAAPLVVAYSISAYGWRWSFCAAGALTLSFFALWAARVRDYPGRIDAPPPRPATAAAGDAFLAILRSRSVLLLAVSYAGLGYLYGMFDYWIYYYLRDVRHIGQESSALFSSVAQATQVVSIPIGGWVSDALQSRFRLGRVWFAVTAFMVSAVFILLGTRSAKPMSTVVFFCLAMGIASGVDATYFAAAIEMARESAGSAYAIVNSGGSAGSFLSPIVLPLLAARFGWAVSLGSASVLIAAGGLGWLFLGKSMGELRSGRTIPSAS